MRIVGDARSAALLALDGPDRYPKSLTGMGHRVTAPEDSRLFPIVELDRL
jgi:hypothetical protein